MLGQQGSFRISWFAIPVLLLAAATPAIHSQPPDPPNKPSTAPLDPSLPPGSVTQHAECSYFTDAQRQQALTMSGVRSQLTEQVTRIRLATQSQSGSRSTASVMPNGGNSSANQDTANMGTIDRYIFQGLAQAGVAPAPPTTDQEFYRRVTLDLTGRIPTAAALTAFLNDTTPTKRAVYIDQLLASPQWVDKWTMFFGDMYLNTTNTSQGTNRGNQGRSAFYNFIKTNLTNNTPYNKVATAVISH